jgi:hypothetical protein
VHNRKPLNYTLAGARMRPRRVQTDRGLLREVVFRILMIRNLVNNYHSFGGLHSLRRRGGVIPEDLYAWLLPWEHQCFCIPVECVTVPALGRQSAAAFRHLLPNKYRWPTCRLTGW